MARLFRRLHRLHQVESATDTEHPGDVERVHSDFRTRRSFTAPEVNDSLKGEFLLPRDIAQNHLHGRRTRWRNPIAAEVPPGLPRKHEKTRVASLFQELCHPLTDTAFVSKYDP